MCASLSAGFARPREPRGRGEAAPLLLRHPTPAPGYDTAVAPEGARCALIIPALNEADSVGRLLAQVPPFLQIIVVDNGSEDSTAEVARAAGAEVVREPRRGYGQACLAGLARVRPGTQAVAFMDADLSDDPADLERLIAVLRSGGWDLVIGSRVLGSPEPGSLTALQRFGNWLTTRLIRCIWGVSFTDLGPLRVVRMDALRRLDLRDPGFGWNVEMQAKAARLRLRVTDVPVSYRRRKFGQSKISGTVPGSIAAGIQILLTVYRCWRDGPAA
jgi:glycosyltransferase involved in cell wall biosynthesis